MSDFRSPRLLHQKACAFGSPSLVVTSSEAPETWLAWFFPHILKPWLLPSCAVRFWRFLVFAVVGDVLCLHFGVGGSGGGEGAGGGLNDVLFHSKYLWSTRDKP